MKHDYKLGQKLLWIVRDFDTTADISAVVTEVYSDHIIAKTQGNSYENYKEKRSQKENYSKRYNEERRKKK